VTAAGGIDPAAVAIRVEAIRERIRARAPGREVCLVAVTKGFGADAIAAAAAAGVADVGENYAQELLAKLDGLTLPVGVARPRIHFIGRLQSNKVRSLAGAVDCWQSVDRPSLVAPLARAAPGATVLVQVNVSDEPAKGGCVPGAVDGLVDAARAAGLEVAGLMAVGRTGPPERARPGFRLLRSLVDRLALPVCSMGMSGDLEVAIEEGSTMVRVGSALFGDRPRPDGVPAVA
jgi:pyridoxal phosphate enzyme (YggS family)